ncbi:MAG: terpene cyclase/mutase family protein [Verrucomicrobiae bacterium]|nr:terpene cyclase/mutase family protein [Verrucomicrobiae bacterium]MDW8343441.1 terpene cyclase/mutase family protein [Verrucomicrobiae bacterium]
MERAISWFVAQQQPTGFWSDNTALQALPLLALLSAGEVRHPAAERGLNELLRRQDAEGAFISGGAMMYGHAIATLTLAESLGMVGDEATVRAALERAVRLVVRAQAVGKGPFHEGGWRYQPTSADSDLSVTVWQVLALRAAAEAGVAVPASAMEQAVRYIRRCAHPQGGFGYQPGGLPGSARTAAALVALRLCGEEARVDWLERNPVRWESPFYFAGAHHAAHLKVGFDAAELIARQNPDGSWPPSPNGEDARRGGPLYCTAMAVLALTAEWKFLPGLSW